MFYIKRFLVGLFSFSIFVYLSVSALVSFSQGPIHPVFIPGRLFFIVFGCIIIVAAIVYVCYRIGSAILGDDEPTDPMDIDV